MIRRLIATRGRFLTTIGRLTTGFGALLPAELDRVPAHEAATFTAGRPPWRPRRWLRLGGFRGDGRIPPGREDAWRVQPSGAPLGVKAIYRWGRGDEAAPDQLAQSRLHLGTYFAIHSSAVTAKST
jgi:hypothetical protein